MIGVVCEDTIVGATINDLPTIAGEISFVSEDNREKVVNSDIFPLKLHALDDNRQTSPVVSPQEEMNPVTNN